ncbi:DUF1707 SHOCT-like domain-containing protein [Aestuariimicrobium sp. Y1814]|uniref:DUF1707 SHOCT-like domain-containing protein n=1 Tax=Aestuariimicrobium sp. Y1814 TaxID=3418742 RepID=UPI003DA77DCF
MAEPLRIRAGDSDRDAVLQVLMDAHAAGRLDMAELDERQTQVITSRYLDELKPLVADLPEGNSLVLMTGPHQGRGLATGPGQMPALHDQDAVVSTVAVMSGKNLKPARGVEKLTSFQFWGGDEVDLTEAFGPGVTITYEAVAIMAGSTITVPEGVRVQDDTVNIMAGNEIKSKAQGDGSNGTLVLSGFSMMAGHTVKLTKNK